jgi:hypothetical protein
LLGFSAQNTPNPPHPPTPLPSAGTAKGQLRASLRALEAAALRQ